MIQIDENDDLVVLEKNKMNTTKELFNKLWDIDLYELLRRKEKYSEYIDWTFEEHFKNLTNEIKELQEEVDSGWDIKSESLDVVYVLWMLLQKLIKEKDLNLDFKEQKEKIFKRSPNLKKCEKVSRETENKIWKIIKNNNSLWE